MKTQPKKYKVRSSELGPVVREWIERHDRDHPLRIGGNKGAASHIPVVQGRDYIARRTGIGRERIQEIAYYPSREYYDFRVADKILCAMDRPDLFHSSVEIIDD